MKNLPLLRTLLSAVLLPLLTFSAAASSFRVQCPNTTSLHPGTAADQGSIKCQQISGGDGFATMGDGTQTYIFSFGPLSGLADIYKGLPGTELNSVFNQESPVGTGTPSTLVGMPDASFSFNGAIGLTGDPNVMIPLYGNAAASATLTNDAVTSVAVSNGGTGYSGPPSVTFSPPQRSGGLTAQGVALVSNGVVTSVEVTFGGSGYTQAPTIAFGPQGNACLGATPDPSCLTGHVDPRPIMDVGVMNGSEPGPLMAIDEDDEFFLTLTNVGMVMRPDLFEQHTVHFHGYPNASSFYDGVPDASVAINIGGSFTYYYLAPDAGTYFWHCHITPPEHLQMGMVGQIYVRPRQNRAAPGSSLYANLQAQQADLRTRSDCASDLLCSSPLPPADSGATHDNNKSGRPTLYAYNDGDGSTAYDVEYPLQMMSFDPNFHFVGMTFNPEAFTDMKDKYFMLSGRSYPDTINPDAITTQSTDGVARTSQPVRSLINIPAGGRALLRLSDLNVSEFHTLASLGIPMHVIALNARLLRDMDGTNMAYDTNSITLGGGESLDVILDATDTSKYPVGSTFYLYTPNLDHLSNDAENFGGMMTEVHICSSVDPVTKACI